MMKKYSWIAALVLALSLAFFACDNGGGSGGKKGGGEEVQREWTVVFDMATDAGIQGLALGKLDITGSKQPILPLMQAGEGDSHVIITAVAGPGEQAVSLQYETVASWGAGIDLRHKTFEFYEGDKITVTGEFLTVGTNGYAQMNFKVDSEESHGLKATEAGDIEWEVTLTAAMVAEISGGNPAGIRIDGRSGGQTVRIDNIRIEGNRPASYKPPVTVTVTFDLDGGTYAGATSIAPVSVVQGTAMGALFPTANPLKSGFIFEAWVDDDGTEYDADTIIEDDVTLTATYVVGDLDEFTVTFDLDGGTVAGEDTFAPVGVVEGQPLGVDFPAKPVKAGYWFEGWFDEGDTEYTSNTAITADVTIKAKWSVVNRPAINPPGFTVSSIEHYELHQMIALPSDATVKADYEMGKGNIIGADLQVLKDAPPYSVAVLYLIVPVGGSANSGGYGIGSFGGANFSTTSSGFAQGNTFYARIPLSNINNLATANLVNVNLYNGAYLQKIEIWKPDAFYKPPIVVESPSFTGTAGSGVNGETGNEFNFVGDGSKIEYSIPSNIEGADLSEYTNIVVSYTLTRLAGGNGEPLMKVSITDGTTNRGYPQSNSGVATANLVYNGTLANHASGILTMAHNNWDNTSDDFTITITKIEFTQ